MKPSLEQRLGHRFRSPELLQQALTHRSAGGAHNERLEFLGDGILNFVIAAALYDLRPEAPEGELSRLRASLVNGPSLAERARHLGLGASLRLGGGELKSGGERRDSILADTLEAVLGAVYLDAGFETTREVVLALYRERLQRLPDSEALKDPKTRLQEALQGIGRPLPEYIVVEQTGEPHLRSFRVQCRVPDSGERTEGEGRSRRRAEQHAAEQMLERVAGDLHPNRGGGHG